MPKQFTSTRVMVFVAVAVESPAADGCDSGSGSCTDATALAANAIEGS
jgi:hypothetical protein